MPKIIRNGVEYISVGGAGGNGNYDDSKILAEIAAIEQALGLKVDAKDGYDLISEEDQKKVDAITLNDDGTIKVDISELSQKEGNTIIFNGGNSAV